MLLGDEERKRVLSGRKSEFSESVWKKFGARNIDWKVEYQNKTLHRVFTMNKVLNVVIFMQNED